MSLYFNHCIIPTKLEIVNFVEIKIIFKYFSYYYNFIMERMLQVFFTLGAVWF